MRCFISLTFILCHLKLLNLFCGLTSGKGLGQNLRRERGLGARAGCRTVLVLQVMRVRVVVLLLPQHVPPASVQETVQDVRGDDVREGERLLRLQARLQAQGGAGQHGAHGGGGGPEEGGRRTESQGPEEPEWSPAGGPELSRCDLIHLV